MLILLHLSQGKVVPNHQKSQESSTSTPDPSSSTTEAPIPQEDAPGRVPWFAKQKKSLPMQRFMFSRDADSAKNDVPWFAKQKKSLPINRFMFLHDANKAKKDAKLPLNRRFMLFDTSSARKVIHDGPNRVPWFAKQKKSFDATAASYTNKDTAPNRIPWFASRQKKNLPMQFMFKDYNNRNTVSKLVPNIAKDNTKSSDVTIPITEYYYAPGPEDHDRYVPAGVIDQNRLAGYKDNGNFKSKDGKKPRRIMFWDSAVEEDDDNKESRKRQEWNGEDFFPPNVKADRTTSSSSSSLPLGFIQGSDAIIRSRSIPLAFIQNDVDNAPSRVPWFAVNHQKKSLPINRFMFYDTKNDEDGDGDEGSAYPLFLYKDTTDASTANSFPDFLTNPADQSHFTKNRLRREDRSFGIKCSNIPYQNCDPVQCINGQCYIVCSKPAVKHVCQQRR